jgi:hypothetical protein
MWWFDEVPPEISSRDFLAAAAGAGAIAQELPAGRPRATRARGGFFAEQDRRTLVHNMK